MASILFAQTYFYRFDEKQWRTAQPYPPYGTMYAAAYLRELGHQVSIFDTGLRESPDEIESAIKEFKPTYFVLYDDGFNYLSKMCLTRMREAAYTMARLAHESGCKVIISSSDSTDHFTEYLAQKIDYVILGEAEITLAELVNQLESGVDELTKIDGIAAKNSSKEVFRTNSRPVLQNLDSLPDPAWDLIDLEPYRAIWMQNHGYFALNLATTRGCPYKCNWCAKPIYGNRYNSRSPERVIDEIQILTERFGVHRFWMADDIFGLKPGWVQRFRDLVKEKKLNFQYKIQSRVDLLLKEDTIDALAESGLRQVWVGAESGSQKILDAMDKGTKVEEIEKATRLLKSKGIEVCFFLQFGYLGETRSDIDATINMVEELMPDDIGISVSYPLPGTKFFEKVSAMLGEKQNWSVSDDLAVMYPATFSPGFYKRLHRLVHKRFRLKQGLREWQNLFSSKRVNFRKAVKSFYYGPAALIDTIRLKFLEGDSGGNR